MQPDTLLTVTQNSRNITIVPPRGILPTYFLALKPMGPRLPVVLYLGAKRLLDLTLVTGGLLVIWPLLLAIALLVERDSPGDVIYRRIVLARQELLPNGTLRTFAAYKFRTMVPQADALLEGDLELRREYEKEFKLPKDPRVTRLGAKLRSLSLDEFPQLFNVLRGEMSLVGPRMISPPELSRYGEHGAALLSVKPGLTGLWQISGRQCVRYEERVQLDVWYIEHRSFLMDLIILWRTVGCVFSRTGAF